MHNHIKLTALLLCSLLLLDSNCKAQDEPSAASGKLANTISELENATTLSHTTSSYRRGRGEKDKHKWVGPARSQLMYKAPSHYRDTRYDKDGSVVSVEILDTSSEKTLRIDMLAKKAHWLHSPTNIYGPGSPTSNFAGLVKQVPMPAIGQRTLDGKTVDVYRHPGAPSMDIWIDPTSGRLVGVSSPGGDQFDPQADIPDGDGPGVSFGRIITEILYGKPIDDKLFEFRVPEGFETVQAPSRPSELELIEWLRVTANFGGGVFHATQAGFDMQGLRSGRSDANRKDEYKALNALFAKHMLNRNLPLVQSFSKGNAVEGSFQYVGGGVKLGSVGEIVCWYKHKDTGQSRAIYGDLSVKDIQEQDLPAVQD